MDIIYEKWDEILETVKKEHELSDVSFKTWLKPLKIHKIDDQVVTILVPSQQVGLNYISKKYALPLKVAISELTGEDYDIHFILPEDVVAEEKEKPVIDTEEVTYKIEEYEDKRILKVKACKNNIEE